MGIDDWRYGVRPPGYRLPEATRVGGVRLQVSDLGRSLDFYERVLGLGVLDRTDGSAVLAPPGSRPLMWLQQRRGARPVPRRGAFGLYHFALLLPDRAALGRFAAHALRLGIRPGMADHLVSEAFYLNDPDGLGIEVYADRPRSAWRRDGRELAMATDPLDIENVMAAGGGRAWDAAPEATTIGHLHLHVGSLAEGEAFYHAALGFDKVGWSYPGALFLSAGGYHHHLGINTWSPGPAPADDQAQLLEWQIVVPSTADASGVARSLETAGYVVERGDGGWSTKDPWGTRLRIDA